MNTLEIITSYDVAKESECSAFSELRDASFSFSDKDSFFSHLRLGEDEYMEYFHSDEPEAKKGNGTWKYRTYLPKGYSSAKSVIGTAVDLNIKIVGKGKTEIEKEIRSLKNQGKDDTTPEERAISYVTKLKNVYSQLDQSAKDNISNSLRSLIE